eukprot:c29127_g1_i1 orf=26-307(+)
MQVENRALIKELAKHFVSEIIFLLAACHVFRDLPESSNKFGVLHGKSWRQKYSRVYGAITVPSRPWLVKQNMPHLTTRFNVQHQSTFRKSVCE